jgi:hypothetical protein
VGHTAWAKRTRTHPRVLAALAAGELTPERAEVAGRVLDALGAPAGKEDDRTRDHECLT